MTCKIITLYNHKGGVSKTTTTFNMAHLFAENGKRVLVVDADPQCNLTELLLSKLIEEIDVKQEASEADADLPGTSLLQLMHPRISGERPDVDIADVKNIFITDNLYLLRGDVALSEIEEALAEAHIQRFSNKTHEKKTHVALGAFLRKYGEENNFDYILLDVGPSSGALTRACFLICDGFFVPTVPDRFNVQAIRTLAAILDRWMSEHEQIYKNFKELGLPVELGKLIFLGIILQNYKLYRGEPRKGYKFWIKKIPIVFHDKLLLVLSKHSIEGRDLTRGLTQESCIAANIPDFQSLAPLLQGNYPPP
ncbi:ParA family protein [Methylobacterium sp. J-090]|uniref:ParA family protein n=1 Tax=Methylobacterium sp. J-090 TaxID=2836666 RepID=UPI001FB9C091|nr:ParA family protein [Methylobacterium sp. J-090]MCJ2080998.1 ParA family protein [Methylobacterium sp. J-090]